MPRKVSTFTICFIFLSIVFLVQAKSIHAQSCTADISPSTVGSGSVSLSYSVTNLLAETVISARITNIDSGIFELTGGSTSGWTANLSGTVLTFSGGTLGSDQSTSFTFSANALTTGTGTFEFELSPDGSGFSGCEGTSQVTVATVFTLSGLQVSASSTSATVSWTTSEAASSNVSYGTTTSYGSTAGSSNLATSHSVGLTGLSASTTYYYQVCSTNGGGQQSCSGQNTFTTSASGTTTTTTTTATSTSSSTTTTATPALVDKNAPTIKIDTDFSKSFEVSPEITGKATDTGAVNVGIKSVEYSIDGGANWLPVDDVDLGGKSTSFSFTPNIFEDGNFEIKVRATDFTGNKGVSKAYTLVIDRLPPLVGGNIFSIGPIALLPNENGVLTTMAGIDHKVTMSAVGGPISIELLAGDKPYPLTRSVGSGLWSGVINFESPGFYKLKVKSLDGAGNETIRDLNSVLVASGGKVIEKETGEAVLEAKIRIYQQDSLSKIWSLWQAEGFGQKSIQETGSGGEYSYFLPGGTYHLTITKDGYQTITSKIFKINTPTALNADFEMEKAKVVKLGPFSFSFPNLNFNTTDVALKSIKSEGTDDNSTSLIGKESPGFLLSKVEGGELNSLTLRGSSAVLIFINSWLPTTSEQISIIESLSQKYKDKITFVVVEESLSKTSIFIQKGAYEGLSFAVDPDGTLVESYKINSLPKGVFIDRKGIIQKVLTGVILGSDIMNYLDSF